MQQYRPRSAPLFTALLFVGTILLPLAIVPTAGAAPLVPALETLVNPSLEGAANEKNGFTLQYDGAETAPIARTGSQSVNLARATATPEPWFALGLVRVYATHPVLLTQVQTLSFYQNVPAEPARAVGLISFFRLDLDGDAIEDVCLLRSEPEIHATSGWSQVLYDATTSFTVTTTAACDWSGTTRTIADLQADPLFAGAQLRSLSVETVVTSTDPWPVASQVYVDDFSVRATSSPLVRIQQNALNACNGASFDNVQLGIDCAVDGATILVGPGTLSGSFRVTKPVTICGTQYMGRDCTRGPFETIIRGTTKYPVWIAADGVRLINLTIENPGFTQTGDVDPSLVVVDGDLVELRSLKLRQPASDLGLNQWRNTHAAISIRPDVDGLAIHDVDIADMPSSLGPNARCGTSFCVTVAISHWGQDGDALHVRGGRIDMGGAHPAYAIGSRNDNLTVDGVTILTAGGSASAVTRSSGIVAYGSNRLGWTLQNNLIDTSADENTRASDGIIGDLRGARIVDNTIRTQLLGVAFAPGLGGANVVERNLFEQNLEGIHNNLPFSRVVWNRFVDSTYGLILDGDGAGFGLSSGIVAQNNTFVRGGLGLRVNNLHPALAVDARFNDWGVYSREAIKTRFSDLSKQATIDTMCFRDSDDAHTPVCPPTADFRWSPGQNTTWGAPVQFINTSLVTRRPIVAHHWFLDVDVESGQRDPVHTYAAPGARQVTLIVTDSEGYTARTTKMVDIINRAPVFAPISNKTVAEGGSLSFIVSASDPDKHPITYGAVNLPAGATFNSTSREFKWKPSYTQEGLYTDIGFTATDGFATATRFVPITVTHVNGPPAVSIAGKTTIEETEELRLTISTVEPDGEAVRLKAFPLQDGMTFVDHLNGTATVTWTPTQYDAGDYTLVVEASDPVQTTQVLLDIIVLNHNHAPVFQYVAPQTITETERLQFLVAATDADGDALGYGIRDAPAGSTFNATSRVFTWIPTLEQAGDYTVNFLVTDGTVTSVLPVVIHVLQKNRPPVLGDLVNQTAKANRTLQATLSATDPENDVLTFSIVAPPEGLVLDGASLTWTPTPDQVGVHVLHVQVADPSGEIAHGNLTVTVAENLAPVVLLDYASHIDVGQQVIFRTTGSHDPDGGPTLLYEWDFNDTDGIGVDRTSGSASWIFPNAGLHNVTLRVTDQDGIVTVVKIPLQVDDIYSLEIRMGYNTDFTRSWYATVGFKEVLRWSPSGLTTAGVPNHELEVWVTYDAGKAVAPEIWRGTVVTKSDGWVTFTWPRDLALLTVPGTHRLHVRGVVPDSYLGDTEVAQASQVFATFIV